MAALVKDTDLKFRNVEGVGIKGPTRVAFASETDLSTPDTSITFDTRGVTMMAVQIVFANYTSVTVKAWRSLNDGTTKTDITGATTSTSGAIFDFDPKAPLAGLSIAGTLSGSADTMSVYVYQEYAR